MCMCYDSCGWCGQSDCPYYPKTYIKLKGSGAVVECKVHEHQARRPIRKKGQRLGTWTNKKFYQPMSLVSFTTPEGNHHMQWVKTSRITDNQGVKNGTVT
jgi:hypothetical protein